MKKILIVDDKENISKVLKAILEAENYIVDYANDVDEAIRKAKSLNADLIISDIRMPKMSGIEFYETMLKKNIKSKFIFMTAYGSIPMAVKAMKLGASEFLTKPLDYDELKIKIRNLIGQCKIDEKDEIRKKYKRIIGESKAVYNLLETINMAADYSSTVLIQGESGSGKELVAKALHYQSQRRENNFVAVNCAALNHNIIESELFGHKKGSFTGAIKDKKGKFELADQGTIMLDEITEISLDTQSKLLRVLQEKKFERVGENISRDIDVRVIATTNRDIKKMVRENEFRSDLFYRLNVIPINVPPLRERKSDTKILIDHFIKKISDREGVARKSISDKAVDLLKKYNWPGNIRELENLTERLIVTSKNKEITVQDLPPEIIEKVNFDQNKLSEKEKIINSLTKSSGNKTKAAQILGISRKTLYNWIKKYKDDKEVADLVE
ncbi:two-component system response regulator AtoC [Halanaerobium saccharolyticum]|jgi:two-component system response regulator AtoC|uniref:Stage 0 sporulation protein A homolog n=1 Tax=Halanaerobium saccharolyticum TaxID=43595 RepID=A0A2T5RFB9_9FIRM|nr:MULTISPECIES: sigma-54 dependent transcriptional regulator [Halanaerobium]KXS49256.1 MAG: Fis family transcriptional regulator [Halanaerobium sp. T82-1]PTV92998.1 two-component system response regulator AtoC [Halanaerobium saccharolyticum]TDP90643.1 two-component system response regulator AtoC [Halanaerobium saccharolyticum]SHM25844.1 two-component system, NtrC family, response regulator AtoC [Halanaerobium congolense]